MINKNFKGAGGGGGGGGGEDFVQRPDNLRSEDTFEGLMGLAIGPLKGPTNGLKSIRLDGTPIENASGTMNFPGFVTLYTTGDPANWPEKPKLRLGAAAAPQSVNLGLVHPPTGDSVWVTRTLNNPNADFMDLRFIVSQLYKQDKNGTKDNTATIEIHLKPTGSANWINFTTGTTIPSTTPGGGTTGPVSPILEPSPSPLYGGETNLVVLAKPGDFPISQEGPQGTASTGTYSNANFVITGKTSSPVVYELRIALPTTGAYANVTWDVRARLVEKDTVDNDPNFEKRTIAWESIAAGFNDELGEEPDWKGVAWMQFYGKASNQLSGVPDVEVEMDAKIVSVPPTSVYNPTTRLYTNAIWDGSWGKAWTTDPAWIINDIISDELSGISLLAPGSHLNKWDALEASKWFSEPVPDGKGGFHPRYSMNVVANQQMKAEDFVRYVAGAVGGFAWDEGDGQWRMKVDKPDAPVDIFTLESIEGEFNYSHTDIDTRFNHYTGTFLNAEFDYREDTVQIYDNQSIALIGQKPTNIALIGCTNRQEALRRLMIRMRSSVNETKLVTFTTNRRGRNIEQLDTILIADGHLGDQESRTTGRTVSIAPDRKSVVVRDSMRLELGINYQLKFAYLNPGYSVDGTTQPTNSDWKKPTVVLARQVTNTAGQRGSVTTIYLDAALPADLPDNLAVALEAPDLPTMPKLYRVTNVQFEEDGERVTVSAMEVDTGKWDASDNVSNVDTVFQDLRGSVPQPLPPPDNDMLSLVRSAAEQGENVSLVANWTRPPGASVSGFRVTYSVNGGNENVLVDRTTIPQADLVNPPHGTYVFKVYTLSRTGVMSEPLVDTQVVDPSTIAAAEIFYSGGTQTLEDLRPAEGGADVTGNNTSLDTANVNGVPAGTVTANIATAATQIAGIQSDISDLEATYGDTFSAAQSAEAAALARDAAQAAQTAANTSAGNALTQANLASGYASNASGSATAAAGSASSASGSATTAGNSATAASASAVSATLQAASLLPDVPTSLDHWSTTGAGAPSSLPSLSAATYSIVSDAHFGSAIQAANVATNVFSKGVLPVVAGRIYEIQARAKFTVGTLPLTWTAIYGILNDSYAALTTTYAPGRSETTLDTPYTLTTIVNCNTILAAQPSARWLRFGFHKPAGSGSTIRFGLLAVRDVTNREAAAGSASAAATSASAASTSATNAGTSASAAQTSATNASTSAGQASTSATNAATSATTATGSMNTASTHASNAATSASNASGSASAASTSASTASTHATNAGNSASTASTHAQTASTQAGNASTSATNASTSATNASNSASAAATSATLSASFVGSGNFLSNTEFPDNRTNGWTTASAGGLVYSSMVNGAGAPWHPVAMNVLSFYQSGSMGNASNYAAWQSEKITIQPSGYYQAHVMAAAHSAQVALVVRFYTTADVLISQVTNTGGVVSVGSGGVSLGTNSNGTGFTQLLAPSFQAPSNAAYCEVQLRKYDTVAGPSESWAWFGRPYFGMARQGQTLANNYTPGSGTSVQQSLSASITTQSSAIAGLQGQAATFEQRLTAGGSNLIPNSSFESGFAKWTTGTPGFAAYNSAWGSHAYTGTDITSVVVALTSDLIPVYPSTLYTVSGDLAVFSPSTASYAYFDVVWFKADGTTIAGETGQVFQYATTDFSNHYSRRPALKTTGMSSVDAAYAKIRVVAVPTGSITGLGVRQLKLEQGDTLTAYSQEATALYQAGVLATHEGKLGSYLQLSTSAGSATASVRLVSTDGSGNPTSSVAIEAQEFVVTNSTGGVKTVAMRLVDGSATFYGDLTIGGRILFTNGLALRMAVAPYIMNVTDGQSITYPNAGSLPVPSFSSSGLAPLASGENYNLYLENQTAGGATVRLKINTPSTPSSFSLTSSSVDGGGVRYVNKGSSADAINNSYRVYGSASHTQALHFESDANRWEANGEATINFYGMVSGSWVLLYSKRVYSYVWSNFSGNGTKVHNFDETSISAPSGVTAFGVTIVPDAGEGTGTVTAVNAAWTAAGTPSSTRSATPNGELCQLTLTY